MARKRIDLTGKRFGRLTVVKFNEEKTKEYSGRASYWDCKCDCGNVTTVRADVMKKGKVNSCGCFKSEASSERMKEQLKDEEFVKKQKEATSKTTIELWKNDNYRQNFADKAKKRWQDDDFRQKMTGEHSSLWKNGTTNICSHFRKNAFVNTWAEESKKQANYTCQLTGKKSSHLNTHHLYSFSNIVIDAHKTFKIEIKQQVKEYTYRELQVLENYIYNKHKDFTNAIVLCDEAHNLFHKLYGKGNNTPEQYIEFKERYLAGEFKEILK